jgi:hypothetical protein
MAGMALSEECKERLHNWKFERAQDFLAQSEPDIRETELVKALAAAFGNSGWFDGHMGFIVGTAVSTLIGDEDG